MRKYLTIFLLFLVMLPACSKSGEETETTTTSETDERTLEGNSVLLIVAQEQFKDIEYEGTREYLEKCGADITVATNTAGECKGMDGMTITADISLGDVVVDNYDAIILIGGQGVLDHISGNERVHEIIKTGVEDEMVVGAICLAPMVLAEAGVLDGLKATVAGHPTALSVFEEGGVEYISNPVVISGDIITADGPGAVDRFAVAIEGALVD